MTEFQGWLLLAMLAWIAGGIAYQRQEAWSAVLIGVGFGWVIVSIINAALNALLL